MKRCSGLRLPRPGTAPWRGRSNAIQSRDPRRAWPTPRRRPPRRAQRTNVELAAVTIEGECEEALAADQLPAADECHEPPMSPRRSPSSESGAGCASASTRRRWASLPRLRERGCSRASRSTSPRDRPAPVRGRGPPSQPRSTCPSTPRRSRLVQDGMVDLTIAAISMRCADGSRSPSAPSTTRPRSSSSAMTRHPHRRRLGRRTVCVTTGRRRLTISRPTYPMRRSARNRTAPAA